MGHLVDLKSRLSDDLLIKKIPYVLFEDEDAKVYLAVSLILHLSVIPLPDVLTPIEITTREEYPYYYFYHLEKVPLRLVLGAAEDYLTNHLYFYQEIFNSGWISVC